MGAARVVAVGLGAAVLLAVGAVGVAYAVFLGQMRSDVDRLTSQAKPVGIVITDAMLAGLPPAAQRYFHHAGVVGQAVPRIVRLTQKGRIRSNDTSGWMELEAEEVYSTNPPAFVWRAYFPNPTMPVALGRDEYLDGKGSILMKMLALAPLADEHGDELAAAGLMRYLNEATWFPAAFLAPGVTIAPVDDFSFGVSISDRGLSASAVIVVDENGRIINFRAQRYNTSTRSLETWETPMSGWGQLAGLELPTGGAAVWKLPEGDLAYIELEITSLHYEE